MSTLSGNKDADLMILQQLNDVELGKVCKLNKYVNKLCQDSNFYLKRIPINFPYLDKNEVIEMREFFNFDNYKELYIYLKTFPIEKQISYRLKKVDRKDVINLLKKMKLIDNVINDVLKPDLPDWIRRDVLIYTLRRKFPEFILESSGYGDKLIDLIYRYLKFSIPNFTNIVYDQDQFVL